MAISVKAQKRYVKGLVPGSYQPGPTTTGVPAGTVLSVISPGGTAPILTVDEAYVEANGGRGGDGRFYLENKDILAQLRINTNNVTVRKCRIRGYKNSASTSLPFVRLYQTGVTGTVLEDCTISPDSANREVGQNAVQGFGFTARRCQVTGVVDGFVLMNGDPVIIEACYVNNLIYYAVDPAQTDGSHNDCVQVEGGIGHTILGCYFVAPDENNAAIQVTQNDGLTQQLVISKNWMGGGRAATLNLAEKAQGAIGVSITDNVFLGNNGTASHWDIISDSLTRDSWTYSGNTKEDGSAVRIFVN